MIRATSNIALLVLVLITIAVGDPQSRIVGGSVTTIDRYPEIASLQISQGSTFQHNCGGTILNNRSILTAAHCFMINHSSNDWRVRVGSSFASRSGSVYYVNSIILHPNFEIRNFDSDIAIIRLSSVIVFSNVIQVGNIAGPNYNVANGQVVWAAGWGDMGSGLSEHLRHIQIWKIGEAECRKTYGNQLSANMLCSGWIAGSVGQGSQCSGDSGGPLYHNRVVVGVTSFGAGCGTRLPLVNVRVSRFTNWIQNNA